MKGADEEAARAAAALEEDEQAEAVEEVADEPSESDDDGHDEQGEAVEEVADEADGDDPEGDGGATLRETEESAEPEGGTETFLQRWFRNDRELDLDDTKAIWDPWGKGGLNRIAAAAKQAGGYKHFAPAFWASVGAVEVGYKFMVLKGLIPGKSPPKEGGE